jgi:hypothetical protein
MIKTRARTARTDKHCDSCRGAIERGERYLEHIASPHHAELENERWWRMSECGECARRYGRGELLEGRGARARAVSAPALVRA